ncbi:MAG TPA: tetratricopeptide repeat protein [Thermoanaerobaculales bacterium]|nr:tetratricopeptide repeat protein [Thermoanaerobaculales bacterium]
MIRRLLCALAVMLVPAWGHSASALADDWLKVQRALAASDREEFTERVRQLQARAADCQALRLTPYAEALVTWASRHPDALGAVAVRAARELDPELPSSHFLVARWQWKRGSVVGAARSYIGGWWALFAFEPTRAMLGAAAGGWVLLSLGWAILLAVLVQTVTFLPRVAHDAVELARLALRPANATVLALAVLVLPLFGGLGPTWLLMYLFALGWAYMATARQRVAAVVSCALLAVVVPLLAAWQQATLRWPVLETRVASMLDERRIDFPTLHELGDLDGGLGDNASFRVLLGELHRMHGDFDQARIEFQRAVLADAGNPMPRVFLGNLALEDGDVQLAIQMYNDAIRSDPREALAHRNLSFAYDQARRFKDGDAARTTAKEIAGADWQELGIPGRDARIRYPRLGREDVEAVMASVAARSSVATRMASARDRFVQSLFSPTSLVFWLCGALGVVVLLARSGRMWTAQRCSKCGRTFCEKCKTASDNETLCSQCISVFLKRDLVAVDQQLAKQARVRRWDTVATVARRAAGVLLPGSHDLADGRPWLGLATGALAWLCLLGALAWAPRVLPSVDPFAAVVPVQVALGAGFLALWLRSIIGAWQGR